MQIAAMTTRLNPVGWMGPIFDKELRVASRRKRTYWLRLAYIGAMGFFLIPIWAEMIHYSDWGMMNSLSVSDEAINITLRLILFQFVGLQILAAIFLSSSISEEITRRTLGALWTTPIRGFEIIIGKLSSKLAILVQLLAISLPFLMMLRMFGGIPWGLIVGGCAMVLATVILIGSLSLFLSVFFRKPHVVLVWIVLILFLAFILIPAILGLFLEILWPHGTSWRGWDTVFILTNPYFCMIDFMDSISMGMYPFPWGSIIIQLGISFLLLIVASKAIRRRGLRAMSELPKREEFHPERYHPKVVFLFRPWFAHMLIKRLLGPGMIWKESVSPFFRSRHRMLWMILMAIGIAIVVWTLIVLTIYDMWKVIDNNIQMVLVLTGFTLGVLLTSITSVTVITSEIEGRSWPILMTTPLSNDHILGGKIYGVLRRSGWVWMGLLLWGLISYWQKTLEWTTVGFWIPILAATVWFIISMGFYLSLRYQRAMPAILVNLVTLFVLWIILPYAMQYTDHILDVITDALERTGSLFVGVLEWIFDPIPFGRCIAWCSEYIENGNPFHLMMSTVDRHGIYFYRDYRQHHIMGYMIFTIALYGLGGQFFCVKARKLMRQRVFG